MSKRRKSFFKKSRGSKLFDFTNVVFMLFFCITVIFPVWDMLVLSVSSSENINYLSLNLWPKKFDFQAYKFCFDNPDFYNAYVVSISRTLLGTFYHLIITCVAAFILTRTRMPYRRLITMIFLIPMFFSGGLIPQYILYRQIGFINNFLVYILPDALSFFTVIIVRNFFMSIDSALEEAAIIDGANVLQVLFKVILPLSKPVIATIALWHMVRQWNSWFDNMVFAPDEKLMTAQFLLRKMMILAEEFQRRASAYAQANLMDMHLNSDTIKAATTILVIAPIIATYPFLQKYFVKGIMIGSVKG